MLRITKNGDLIHDAGGGTGTTSILALKKSGEKTKSVVLDFSENMPAKAKEKPGKMILNKFIGIIPWFFRIIILQKIKTWN